MCGLDQSSEDLLLRHSVAVQGDEEGFGQLGGVACGLG